MHLELFAFEYFDERTRRWIRARYRAAIADIAVTHAQYRTIGEPEIREVEDDPVRRLPTKPRGPDGPQRTDQ